MEFDFPTTAGALSQIFDATLIGDAETIINGLSPLPKASEGTLSFCASRKYGGVLNSLRGAIVITREELVRPELPLTYLVVEDPQSAFAEIAKKFSTKSPWKGISPQAIIHPTAKLDPSAAIAPYCVISEGAVIGAGTVLYPYVFVGSHVEIGQNCLIYPNVSLLEKVKIGNRVKIFPGAVLGADGFGLMPRESGGEGNLSEMPQIGNVVIEDDVRIGANSTIDRGTLGETRIGKGSKLDDQVHIGHNSKIGRNCILCGQVGLSGSVVVEDNVVMGGQVGVSDHMKIGKGARIGGQAGVGTDLQGGEEYFGSPALPMKLSLRILRQFKRLPELVERIRALEEVLGKKGKSHD